MLFIAEGTLGQREVVFGCFKGYGGGNGGKLASSGQCGTGSRKTAEREFGSRTPQRRGEGRNLLYFLNFDFLPCRQHTRSLANAEARTSP